MTDYLIDTSLWARAFSRDRAARARIDEILRTPGDLLVTCVPQVLEFCHGARSPAEYAQYRAVIERGFPLQYPPSVLLVLSLQESLWNTGLVRAAGALDILIAAYAIENGATVLSADRDFLHIAQVSDLRVEYIAPAA